jgi:hypothetical protein
MNFNTMSRRPSRDETDQDLRWFHGKINRQEAEALLTNGLLKNTCKSVK